MNKYGSCLERLTAVLCFLQKNPITVGYSFSIRQLKYDSLWQRAVAKNEKSLQHKAVDENGV